MVKKENLLHKSRRDNILIEINNTYHYKCRRHEIFTLFRSYGTIDWTIAIVSTTHPWSVSAPTTTADIKKWVGADTDHGARFVVGGRETPTKVGIGSKQLKSCKL